MSLIDALLLDPPRIDVWVTVRSGGSAGILGTGTQNDPFTVLANTPADFDALWATSPTTRISNNSCVHLGPGVFQTTGYYDGISGGWQLRPGIRIVGSGIDVTTIQLVNTTASKNIYAVGHALTTSADYCEVSSLTIDCNFSANSGASSFGAVRIMGNHSRVVQVKVKNWGSKQSSGNLGYVIGMLTGDGTNLSSAVTNCGIQDCIVIEPGSTWTRHMTALHVGFPEGNFTQVDGTSPYIRNCFVDGGRTTMTDGTPANYARAMAMAWCKGGVVEGNQIQNIFQGGPFSTLGAVDITIRNNTYRNVAAGPNFQMAAPGGGVYAVKSLLIENNVIELTPVDVKPTGISDRYALGVITYNNNSGVPYGNVIVRNNKIGYLNGQTPGNQKGSGAMLIGVNNLLVRENVLDLNPTPPSPALPGLTNLSNKACVSVQYFENRAPAGKLVQGFKEENNSLYTELATDADDGFILSLLRHRA
ncbi:MAG: hypothetical protein JNN07_18310 [Verrucomicrobiales bacterium]|nr:hypothetical protein [Verrucomicrobiales bacterium]